MRGADVREVRARVTAGMSGVVLEIGFGSGLNVPHYPAGVTRVLAVDPALVGRRLAATRIAAHAVPVEFIGTDAQSLPVADACADFVISTWTLCTIPDPDGRWPRRTGCCGPAVRCTSWSTGCPLRPGWPACSTG